MSQLTLFVERFSQGRAVPRSARAPAAVRLGPTVVLVRMSRPAQRGLVARWLRADAVKCKAVPSMRGAAVVQSRPPI